jgi:hypothetical protein
MQVKDTEAPAETAAPTSTTDAAPQTEASTGIDITQAALVATAGTVPPTIA